MIKNKSTFDGLSININIIPIAHPANAPNTGTNAVTAITALMLRMIGYIRF